MYGAPSNIHIFLYSWVAIVGSRGSQKDVVYLGWVFESKCGGMGGGVGVCGVLANECSCVHHVTWRTPYLTNGWLCAGDWHGLYQADALHGPHGSQGAPYQRGEPGTHVLRQERHRPRYQVRNCVPRRRRRPLNRRYNRRSTGSQAATVFSLIDELS